MNTVYLFYKSSCILKIKVALISCMWSKVRSKAGENSALIRPPPAESVAGLNNREIAPISSPPEIGVQNQTTLASPLGSKLVGVIWLTQSTGYVSHYWSPGWWSYTVHGEETCEKHFHATGPLCGESIWCMLPSQVGHTTSWWNPMRNRSTLKPPARYIEN